MLAAHRFAVVLNTAHCEVEEVPGSSIIQSQFHRQWLCAGRYLNGAAHLAEELKPMSAILFSNRAIYVRVKFNLSQLRHELAIFR